MAEEETTPAFCFGVPQDLYTVPGVTVQHMVITFANDDFAEIKLDGIIKDARKLKSWMDVNHNAFESVLLHLTGDKTVCDEAGDVACVVKPDGEAPDED